MKSVYIETTIPSFYFDTRRSPTIVSWREATSRWWDRHRGGYRLCTSAFVVAELEQIPTDRAKRSLDLLREVPLLPAPERLDEVVAAYVRHRLMPRDARGDAAHLAMASLHSVDFLLTWNCRHLANMNKVVHLATINRRLGIPVPILATPMTLIPEFSP